MNRSAVGLIRHPALLCALALVSLHPASATSVDDDLARVEEGADDLTGRARILAQQVAAGTGSYGVDRASERYQDAVYAFLLGKYTEAAEGFFVLVRSDVMVSLNLQWEAQWYLAESLFLGGHLDLAEDTYRVIAADNDHVFRPDSVRRLLEIYAAEDDASRFDALFASEILRGKVEPNDLIRYSVARAFHRKGDAVRAKSWLSEIAQGSPYFLRARYWMAAMLIELGDPASLSSALDIFVEIASTEAVAKEDAAVKDLAWLAQARIFEHRGDFGAAVQAYSKVSDDGAHRADKLHELAWVYIEQQAYQLALKAVEDFLKAFPDHQWAADLRLVRGHLQFEQGSFDDALNTYGDVVDSYQPVKERFEAFAEPGRNTRATVSEVLAAANPPPEVDEVEAAPEGEEAAAATPDTLPGWAVAIMMDDSTFSRGLAMYAELLHQESEIVVSETILADLQGALGGASTGGSVDAARVAVVEGRLASLEQRLALLKTTSAWLNEASGGAVQAELVGLDGRRGALEADVSALSKVTDRVSATLKPEGGGANIDGLEKRAIPELQRLDDDVTALFAEFRALREPAGLDPDMDPTGARLDRLQNTLTRTSVELTRLGGAIGTLRTDALENLRGLFRMEATAVAQQRADLEAAFAASEPITAWLMQGSFHRLAEVFGNSVLGADMGIVNIHWSRLVDTGAERDQVSEERNALLEELERQYGYVERQVQP